MFGLSFACLQRSAGQLQDFDQARDEMEVLATAEESVALLEDMRRDAERPRPPAAAPAPVEHLEARRSPPARAQFVDRQSTAVPLPKSVPGTFPIRLTVAASPARSRVDERVSLIAELTNVSETHVAVNQRLLLNHADTPEGYGELVLRVEGPPGYENLVSFHVRSGRPTDEHFGVLEPGQSVQKTFRLWKYESLHVPGSYRVQLLYQNSTPHTVEGTPVVLGSVSSNTVEITRER
jgi:hypothetical protein